jgi:hypothetical protein
MCLAQPIGLGFGFGCHLGTARAKGPVGWSPDDGKWPDRWPSRLLVGHFPVRWAGLGKRNGALALRCKEIRI